MEDDLRSYVSDLPVFDVHEHHMPDILGDRDVGLLALFWQSYGGWTQARPYPLPSETRFEDPMFASLGPGSWEEVATFVQDSGSNAFVRNLIRALTDLYHLDEDGITPENWERVDAEIRRHSDGEVAAVFHSREQAVRIDDLADAYWQPCSNQGDAVDSVSDCRLPPSGEQPR